MRNNETLIDRDRASFILEQAGLAALVVSDPKNVYYATNNWPLLSKMGWRSSSFAIIPRDPKTPIAYVTYQFIYYYSDATFWCPNGVEPYLVTGPTRDADIAAQAHMFTVKDGVTSREQLRRDSINALTHFFVSLNAGLKRALQDRGLLKARIGYDSLMAQMELTKAAPESLGQEAINVMKTMRLIKTPREISLMRTASAANVASARATAKKFRELGCLKNIRADFYNESVRYGNKPVFMSVDGVTEESHDEPLKEGSAVLIDCVSSYRGYHGDYGRTIFIGDPPKETAEAAHAVITAWSELRLQLKPGLRFSEVSQMGQNILSKLGSYTVPFGPHSVGLAHTDQPFTDLDGKPLDIVLEPGMILSVDCPLMEAGLGGTVHHEDLVLIKPDGAEVIHETSSDIIRV